MDDFDEYHYVSVADLEALPGLYQRLMERLLLRT